MTDATHRPKFEVVQRPAAARLPPATATAAALPVAAAAGPATATPPAFRPGIEDPSGRGAIGLTIGVIGGYALSYLYAVPLLGRARTMESVTLMTTVVMASMIALGALGYFATRRRPRA